MDTNIDVHVFNPENFGLDFARGSEKRLLINRDLIEKILVHAYPQKLKLQVLVDIFDSFLDVSCADPVRLFALQTPFKQKNIIFPYEEKLWCGRVDCQYVNYNKRQVLFTNIELPNDGFFYGSEYYGGRDDIIETDEVVYVVNHLLGIFPTELTVGDTEVNYKLGESRFEIYQWNDDRSKCLTIKYEYRAYEIYQNKKKFTLRKLDIEK